MNLLKLKRLVRIRRDGLCRESAKRRQRRVRVRNTRDAALVFLRRFRRASPRENASAAGEKLSGVSGVRRVKTRPGLRRLRSVRRQHGIDAAEIAGGNLRLVERDNVKLLFGHELLDKLRRFNTERIVAHETDGELSALPLRIVPRQLTPRQETERALEDVMVVFIAFRMDGGDEKTPLAVRACDCRRLPRHRRTLLAALRVDVAVVRRDDFNIGILHRKRRQRNGTFRITDTLSPLPDSCKLVCTAVEHDRHLGLAAAGSKFERNHAQHIGMPLRRLHKKAASRARADVSATASDKCLDLLATFRSERFGLGDGRAARHDENIRRIKCARSHGFSVDRRRNDILRAGGDREPSERTDVPRTAAHKHRNLERLCVRTS